MYTPCLSCIVGLHSQWPSHFKYTGFSRTSKMRILWYYPNVDEFLFDKFINISHGDNICLCPWNWLVGLWSSLWMEIRPYVSSISFKFKDEWPRGEEAQLQCQVWRTAVYIRTLTKCRVWQWIPVSDIRTSFHSSFIRIKCLWCKVHLQKMNTNCSIMVFDC